MRGQTKRYKGLFNEDTKLEGRRRREEARSYLRN